MTRNVLNHSLTCSLSAAILIGTVSCHNPPHYNGGVISETYIHKYGVEVHPQDWTARGEHGQVIATRTDGVIVTQTYSGGILDGETSYSFPHDNTIEKIETYRQGALVKEVTNYPSGVPFKEVIFLSPTERKITTWYDHGTPKSIETYQDGILTHGDYYTLNHDLESQVQDGEGSRPVRDEFGQLVSTDTIHNGILTSNTTLHPNGHPKAITPYQSGKIEGERKTFLPGGEPDTIEQWSNGKKNGMTIVFKNGNKWAEVPYVNGVKEGTERQYRDGTTLIKEINWNNDKMHGLSSTYIEGVTQKQWFIQGVPVSKVTFDRYQKGN
jgi:antitoxin component YwqK of YwqJK toxin-antitoxin module